MQDRSLPNEEDLPKSLIEEHEAENHLELLTRGTDFGTGQGQIPQQ